MKIYRKLKSRADRAYWRFIDQVVRDVDRLPKYLTKRSPTRAGTEGPK